MVMIPALNFKERMLKKLKKKKKTNGDFINICEQIVGSKGSTHVRDDKT